MRFLYYASVLFCTIGLSVGARDRTDKFSIFNSRSGSKPLELNDALYEEITSTPRDYHVAVLLTALESRFGCVLCRDFQPEWDVIARSWSKAKKNEDMKLLLGTLDFSNGKNTFQKVGGPRLLQ
jgi:oligosaccharyltransferase complex subunit gamma